MLKQNKAITLVALVITILVLLILAGVGTYSGMTSLTKTEDNKLKSELNMVQHAILETYTKYIATGKVIQNNDALVGTNLSDSNIGNYYIIKLNGKYYFKYDSEENKIELKDTNISNYYYLSTEAEFKKIGITNNTDKYIVNYITGEVMNITRLKYSSGNAVYISNN